MVNALRIKRRASGATGAPTTLTASELAYNEMDDTLWYGKGNTGGNATSVVKVGGIGSFLPKTGGALTGPVTSSASISGDYIASSGNFGTGYTPLGSERNAIGWNLSTGSGETDFFNNYTSVGSRSFSWLQRNPGGTAWIEQMQLGPGGLNVNVGNIYGAINITAGNSLYAAADVHLKNGIYLNTPAQQYRTISYQTNGTARWIEYVEDNPETGANAGSNWGLNRYADDGSFLGTSLLINRKTGLTSITGRTLICGATDDGTSSLRVNGQVVITGNVSAGSGYSISAGNSMFADRVWGFRSGTYGGTVGSWETSAGGAAGFRMAMSGGVPISIEFGNADPGYGNFQSIWATIQRRALYVASTDTASFGFWYDGATYFQGWGLGGSDWIDTMTAANGTRRFYGYGTVLVTIDGGGNLTLAGSYAGKPGGGAWSDTSDGRTKNVLGSYDHGLTEVLALRPIRYQVSDSYGGLTSPLLEGVTLKEDEKPPEPHYTKREVIESGQEFIGLIAQETEQYMPELVSQTTGIIDGEEVDDMRILNAGPLTFAFINAFREIDARLRAIEERTS